jgi:LmbE family N-acetylglucosaminyl deacetylase
VTSRTVLTPRGHPARVWGPALRAAPALHLRRRLAGTRILVAAAHADDETLGAAGLIATARRRGADVTLVICTDGAAAFPAAPAPQRQRLARTRRQESLRSAELLGVPARAVHQLGVPDGAAESHHDEMARALGELGAGHDVWLVPWRLDPHPDHRAVGRAAVAARPTATTLWEYPVWMRHGLTPRQVDRDRLRVLHLNRGLRARKHRAVAAHASQTQVYDPAYDPVLPGHVLSLFGDGLEPFFVGAHDATRSADPLRGRARRDP